MSAVVPLLRLRGREITRTWRLWLLPAVTVFLAVTSPLLARFTNDLLAAALGPGADGVVLADPTSADAYAQWTKNLTQLVVFVVIVMAAGAINSEVRSGHAALLLVKPASRSAYVHTHAVALIGFITVTAFVGAGTGWLTTRAIFGEADLAPIFAATAVWAVLAAVLVSASLLASATIDAAAGAAGAGIGAYFVLVILGAIPWLAEYTPAGLLPLTGAIATGTQEADHTLWWPIGTGLLLAAALLAMTTSMFRRREL
ncbi:ABC transporter permease [Streptomyces sp. UH6]|uniref:ABC transporter permease n=1 Tax=Streptomyces sp. UH6 TaxID=2748379 RepID=UPI0015D4D000|nr:ABC transporter permease subunit [Streptomyces sp. UH6]NYV73036.1 ABC transporter permease subunit [Streptomyces sp. UH6]